MRFVDRCEEKDWVHTAKEPRDGVVVVVEDKMVEKDPKTFSTDGWNVIAHIPTEKGHSYVFYQDGDQE